MVARSDKGRNRKHRPPGEALAGAASSKWEWVSAGFGLVLVLGTIGYIGYRAVTTDASVPAITVDHIGTEETPGGYVVKFRARNSGGTTAASLRISGGLSDGSTVIETSEVVVDYLPPRAERQGGLIFENDPARYQIRLEANGYVDP